MGADVIFMRSGVTADTGNCVSRGIQAGLMTGGRSCEQGSIETERRSTEQISTEIRSLSVILCNCQCIKGDRSGGHRTR
ncbi:hypothetical protein C0V15_002129 [Salmonella enterica subsp. enterica serovar Pensacola]|nr:hypothetical protein [Salmonella enterica subsp. enterica serovar Pensacola]